MGEHLPLTDHRTIEVFQKDSRAQNKSTLYELNIVSQLNKLNKMYRLNKNPIIQHTTFFNHRCITGSLLKKIGFITPHNSISKLLWPLQTVFCFGVSRSLHFGNRSPAGSCFYFTCGALDRVERL